MKIKTIYTTHIGDPIRLEIPQEKIDLIEEARNRVFGLIVENSGWRPSLEIDLPLGYELSCHQENFIIQVGWNDSSHDNIHHRLLNALTGYEPRGFVIADLGHYCYEGWEPAIDNRDLSELPDVSFQKEFVREFSNRRSFRGYGDLTNVVLPEHQRAIIPKIYRKANLQIRHINYRNRSLKRDLEDYEKLEIENSLKIAKICKEIWNGHGSFRDLEEYCEETKETRSQAGEESRQHSSGPEREYV